jgi:putative toxin-antitoxin system antitoxin component (TIGR02293 family)
MAGTSRSRATSVEAILGGAAVVYGRNTRGGELPAAVREGLPYRSFENVAHVLELGTAELASLIGVASRTLARRKKQSSLSAVESDRLVGIAQIATLAQATLGSKDHVRLWLRHANRALGGATPLACLDTEPGRRQVEAILFQIRYGMIG